MKHLQQMRKMAEKISSGKGYVAPPEYRALATAATMQLIAERIFDNRVMVRSQSAFGCTPRLQ